MFCNIISRFKHPSTTLVIAPSQGGKSCLVRQMIKNNVYECDFTSIKWCYSYSAPWFVEEPGIEFVHGLPETFQEGNLIVIDDFMHALNEKVADIFTAASHHCKFSVILILQNLFHRCKVMRDISLNSHYIILFKNPRDVSQINCLGRQLYPRNSRFFLDAYIKAVSRPYGHLVIDLHPKSADELRLREGVFANENGIHWIYQPE